MITKSKLVNIALAYSKSNVQDEMRKLFQSYQNGEIVELRNQVDFKYETFSMYTMALNTENNAYDELKVVNVSALDFIEIAESPEVSDDVEFVIVTGQLTIAKKTFDYYQAFCKKHTGRNFKVFVVNEKKTRNSKKPLYK